MHALLADTPDDFQRWTNWADVFALPVGMVSAAWLAFDRAGKAGVPHAGQEAEWWRTGRRDDDQFL